MHLGIILDNFPLKVLYRTKVLVVIIVYIPFESTSGQFLDVQRTV